MASGSTAYPDGLDVFTIPSDPQDTVTSSAGDGTRDLPQSIGDQGAAIMALEANAAQKPHTHAGGPDGTSVLSQSSTHANADTDTADGSIHHTLGVGQYQAAPGNHIHNYAQMAGAPLLVCTSVDRPPAPFVGQTIFETDTGIWRQWFAYSTPTPVWQILPLGKVPVFRAETHADQEILPDNPQTCFFTNIIEDFFWSLFGIAQFMVIDTSNTDITIPEPGVYHVHISLCWDPARTNHDQSFVKVTVNGLDISRANGEYIRGYTYTPGFSQTNEIDFFWRFQPGDVLRVQAQHNGDVSSWLWYTNVGPTQQTCYVEVAFHSV